MVRLRSVACRTRRDEAACRRGRIWPLSCILASILRFGLYPAFWPLSCVLASILHRAMQTASRTRLARGTLPHHQASCPPNEHDTQRHQAPPIAQPPTAQSAIAQLRTSLAALSCSIDCDICHTESSAGCAGGGSWHPSHTCMEFSAHPVAGHEGTPSSGKFDPCAMAGPGPAIHEFRSCHQRRRGWPAFAHKR
jgi:hypothetical protein